jgi:hypothetical protein
MNEALTREGLIWKLTEMLHAIQGKDPAKSSRSDLLDLVSEIANSVDGRRAASKPVAKNATDFAIGSPPE